MAKIDTRVPKGMRDFLPEDVLKREYVFGVIRDVFETFGFEPIDTPTLELRETLLGKSGEEADKLIFYAQHPGGKEELALRYDLTVPLSRYVAMHEHDLPLPFRRYHIAPVWRADRPQKGRYREFYQCDADIIGVPDMSADAEIVSVVSTALVQLGFEDFMVKVNNRKILTGIGTWAGVADANLGDLYRSIDKLDKIGLDGVIKELRDSGVAEDVAGRMFDLLQLRDEANGGGLAALDALRGELSDVAIAQEGIRELEEMAAYMAAFGVPQDKVDIDFAMVRGLGYYTGPVFETVITQPDNLGSVTGGGRYDELIGLFRKQSLPTTGSSLGVERIFDLMDLLGLYPPDLIGTVVQVLVTAFNAETQADTLRLASDLRAAGVRTEAYLQPRRNLGKQFKYADRKNVPVVAILGPDEIAQGQVSFKRMHDGKEITVPRDAAVQAARDLLAGN